MVREGRETLCSRMEPASWSIGATTFSRIYEDGSGGSTASDDSVWLGLEGLGGDERVCLCVHRTKF